MNLQSRAINTHQNFKVKFRTSLNLTLVRNGEHAGNRPEVLTEYLPGEIMYSHYYHTVFCCGKKISSFLPDSTAVGK
jgi:hypothetical protein